MRIGVLFSGGKDSVFTTYYYQSQGWDVVCLLTMKSINQDSYMFHTPNVNMTAVQANAMGIPLVLQLTKGEKETELEDLACLLAEAAVTYALDGVAVGALWSDYQQERVNRICAKIGLKTFAPLWHKDQAQLLQDMILHGFDIRLSSYAADGMQLHWLGRKFDAEFLRVLAGLHATLGVHIGGEGGEYESIVLDGPNFRARIEVLETELKLTGTHSGIWDIVKWNLVPKPEK